MRVSAYSSFDLCVCGAVLDTKAIEGEQPWLFGEAKVVTKELTGVNSG